MGCRTRSEDTSEFQVPIANFALFQDMRECGTFERATGSLGATIQRPGWNKSAIGNWNSEMKKVEELMKHG